MVEWLTNLELGLGIDGFGFGLGPSFCDAIFPDTEVILAVAMDEFSLTARFSI